MVEVEIAEICVRVGSCDEDACDEKSNSCERAAQFQKSCSGGMNGCHAEKPSLVSAERQEMPLKLLVSPWSSKSVSLIVSNPNRAVSNSLGLCF